MVVITEQKAELDVLGAEVAMGTAASVTVVMLNAEIAKLKIQIALNGRRRLISSLPSPKKKPSTRFSTPAPP